MTSSESATPKSFRQFRPLKSSTSFCTGPSSASYSHSAECRLPHSTTDENWVLLASCTSRYALRLVVGPQYATSCIHIARRGRPASVAWSSAGDGGSIHSGQHDASLERVLLDPLAVPPPFDRCCKTYSRAIARLISPNAYLAEGEGLRMRRHCDAVVTTG